LLATYSHPESIKNPFLRVTRMPKPMKVKVFMDSNATRIEEQINAFLDYLGSGTIIKTETVATAVEEKPNDGTYPCIVVTIWYEPPSN
jgi:hypothetical protein